MKRRLEFTIDEDRYLDGITKTDLLAFVASAVGADDPRRLSMSQIHELMRLGYDQIILSVRNRPPVDPLHAGPSGQTGVSPWPVRRGPGLMAVREPREP